VGIVPAHCVTVLRRNRALNVSALMARCRTTQRPAGVRLHADWIEAGYRRTPLLGCPHSTGRTCCGGPCGTVVPRTSTGRSCGPAPPFFRRDGTPEPTGSAPRRLGPSCTARAGCRGGLQTLRTRNKTHRPRSRSSLPSHPSRPEMSFAPITEVKVFPVERAHPRGCLSRSARWAALCPG
jgi:hypothetical protein